VVFHELASLLIRVNLLSSWWLEAFSRDYNLGQKGLRIFKNRGYCTHYALNIAL